MSNLKTFEILDESQIKDMDRAFRTALAQASQGSSPLELGLATMDWISHLAISPGKRVQLTQSELTFALTSGGHNAGVISGPEHPRRRYRIHTRLSGDKYIDPDTWLEDMEVNPGSWWPVWDRWVGQRTTAQVKPPTMGANRKGYKPLRDAPGEYVFG